MVTLVVLALGVIALGVWIRANVAEFETACPTGIHRRPHSCAVAPHRRRLAARRVGASPRDGLVHARRVSDRAVSPQRAGVAAESLATVVPISPGGIGTQQALLVYTLRGSALAVGASGFSVGMKLTLTCVNVIVGFTAILLTLRTLRFRRASDPDAAATRPDAHVPQPR